VNDHHAPLIVDCSCGLRYLRTAVSSVSVQNGQARCACGGVIGAWDGAYCFMFEPEDDEQPPLYPRE
jgi:hypothetical protein